MPIFQQISQTFSQIAIWHITESEEELLKVVELHPQERKKYQNFKSHPRRLEFLALRRCLVAIFGQNPNVQYLPNGKPYLNQGGFLSFSHTKNFAAVIYSKTLEVGIDLESFRNSVATVRTKFMRKEECKTLSTANTLKHLTAYWGGKEVILKIEGNRKLDFKKEIRLQPFLQAPTQNTHGFLVQQSGIKNYTLHFKTYPNFLLTYGWLKK
jgi:phosphopantetheinyl transferase